MKTLNMQGIVKGATRYLSKNSTSILTGCGLAGLVGVAVSAVKGTLKAKDAIDDECYEQGVEKLETKEAVKLTWKYYIPTAAFAGATAACFIGAQSINSKEKVALATLCAMTNDNLSEYRKAVTEKIGEKKEEEIRDDISKKRLEEHPVNVDKITYTGSGETLCYDPWTDRYFRSSLENIRAAINDINAEINTGYEATLNDFYYHIGLREVKNGGRIGWNANRMLGVYFSSQISDINDEPCLVMNFHDDPFPLYETL